MQSNDKQISPIDLFINLQCKSVPSPALEGTEFLSWLDTNTLSGYVYARFKNLFSEPISDRLFNQYQKQYLLNTLLLEETSSIEDELNSQLSQPVVRLKGTALLQQLYQDLGERHLTDIDLFIQESDRQNFEELLLARGYQYIKQAVWSASRHKKTYYRENTYGNKLYVDVHTKLLWRQHPEYVPRIINLNNYFVLAPEDQLLNLVANWSYQDNFISFNKLLDIKILLEKYPYLLSSSEFHNKLNLNKLKNSWQYVQAALGILSENQFFPKDTVIKKLFFNKKFLQAPLNNKLNYIYIKHRTKHLKYALLYDWLWLRANGWSALYQFLKRYSP